MDFVVTVLGLGIASAFGIVVMQFVVPQAFPIREHRRAQLMYRCANWFVVIGSTLLAGYKVFNYLL